MNTAFAVAAGLSATTWAIHTFVGGPRVARPLLEAEMDRVAMLTNYYCWHIVTITLATMALGFGYAGRVPGGRDVGVVMTALAISLGLWSLVLVLWKHRRPLELPQWSLFVAISAAALTGVFSG